MTEMLSTDDVDRALVHALEIDGRAPFSRIAGVLGVSDQTVARRYHRLRENGVIRIVGLADPRRLGSVGWMLRLSCTPDTVDGVAAALAKRDDTRWVYQTSGTEITCQTDVAAENQHEQLLERLPRKVAVRAHCILNRFTEQPVVQALNPEQEKALRAAVDLGDEEDGPTSLDQIDGQLVEALGRDGRIGYPDLARALSCSEATAKRRLTRLRRARLLYFDLDVDERCFGYGFTARLWLSVSLSKLAAAGEELSRFPEVAFAAATTGPTNLTASVLCRDTDSLYGVLVDRVSALPGVERAEVTPVTRIVKRGHTVALRPAEGRKRAASSSSPPAAVLNLGRGS